MSRRSRPTTPLRRISKGSLSKSHPSEEIFPLHSLEPAFAELSDSLTDLNTNFEQLSILNESIAKFGESFASFLYGLTMNAFCVDFPEAPMAESFNRQEAKDAAERTARDLQVPTSHHWERDDMTEQTFVTTNTSFIKEPNASQAKRIPQTIARGRGRGITRPAKRGTRGRGT